MWNDAEGHSGPLGGPIVNSHEGRVLSLRCFSPLQAERRRRLMRAEARQVRTGVQVILRLQDEQWTGFCAHS
jgi:hypothetical protein